MTYERFDEALVGSMNVEDITPEEQNQKILLCLKDNVTLLDYEPFDKLWIIDKDNTDGDRRDYIPDIGDGWGSDKEDIGWLGYFLGQNTSLTELYMCRGIDYTDTFYKGLSCNKTIRTIYLSGMYGRHLSDGQALQMLDQFFKCNDSLTEFKVDDCGFQAAGIRQLSLSIGNCKSLKSIRISNCTSEVGLVDIITACSMHPQLTELGLLDNETSIGRNECTALSTLLRCTTTQLQKFDLQNNDIDDEGVKELVNALSNGNQLRELDLSRNGSITIKGWKIVANLLEAPGSKLVELDLGMNNIGDEGALVFAEALTNNSTLKTLGLHDNGITADGWTPFSKLLCDTSSVNNTHLSNHTLQSVCGESSGSLIDNLVLNGSEDKQQVAMTKIVRNHSHFVMEPFFEWEFKVLPIMIDWFEKADSCTFHIVMEKIKRMKLAVVYDFIREFPMLYIEPMTKKEIAEYTVMEEQLQGDQSQQEKLEEIRQRKAHAMRRL